MGKIETQILKLLREGDALTLMAIAERLERKPKKVFKSLRKLFQKDKIKCDPRTRRYSLSISKEG